jgi:hypothetical protein
MLGKLVKKWRIVVIQNPRLVMYVLYALLIFWLMILFVAGF